MQCSPFPERLELPVPSEEILSGHEDVVSSSQDRYTTWVKTDPDVTLERQMVDIQKAVADYREAAARRQESTTQEYFFDTNMPTRFYVQKRLRIYNGNPGPRRGREGAIKMQIAGKWHVITLQEAIDYVDHVLLTNRFHVTHYGGCAVLLNKDTFFSDVDVKSIYVHDTRRELPDKVTEGGQGWVLQGVLFTCLLSSSSSQRPENIYRSVLTYSQYLRQKKTWYCEKSHHHYPSRDAWRTCGPGCGRFQRGCVAMQQ